MKCTEVFQSLTNLYIMHVKHGVIKPPKEHVCMCLNAVCFSMTLMNWRVRRDRKVEGEREGSSKAGQESRGREGRVRKAHLNP